MLEQRPLTAAEVSEMYTLAMKNGNHQSAIEVQDHYKFFGKTVEIVKGKKLTKGTRGVVFYVERKHYSKSPWFGYSTRVGLKTSGGEVVWTSADNLKVIHEDSGELKPLTTEIANTIIGEPIEVKGGILAIGNNNYAIEVADGIYILRKPTPEDIKSIGGNENEN